jgi:hypothetical protein
MIMAGPFFFSMSDFGSGPEPRARRRTPSVCAEG